MNKIIIDSNKLLTTEIDGISFKENKLIFRKNGEYKLEILNSNNVSLAIEILDCVCIKLFVYSAFNELEEHITYKLGENSNLLLFRFDSNKSSDRDEAIYLDGKGAKVSYNFSSICQGSYNYNMKIYHNNCFVSSDVYNKCVGSDGSKIEFLIDSILDKGNSGCRMNQDTKIMCMGDVSAEICPNMLINEDDVEARHGSVIGRFNDEDLFYMMSRGIREDEAIKLMIKGIIFADLVIDDEDRERILKVIDDTYHF